MSKFTHCYFYRPYSLASSKSFIYILCLSKPNKLYKLNKINNEYLIEDSYPINVFYNQISNAWDCGYLSLNYKEKEIQLINDSNIVLATHKIELNSSSIFINQSFENGKFLFAYKKDSNTAIIKEIQFQDNFFNEIRKVKVENISSIDGIYMKNKNNFIISDKEKSVVSEHSFLKGKGKILLRKGRGGKGKVRLPGNILINGRFILLCDRHNYLIQKFSNSFSFINQVGGKGRKINQFDLPSDIIELSDTKFLVADMNNDRVVLINDLDFKVKESLFSREFKPGLLSRPTSMAFVENKIFIADRDNDVIQIFDNSLKYFGFIKKIGQKGLIIDNPTAVAALKINNKQYLAILERGIYKNKILIIICDEKGNYYNHTVCDTLKDPQGMISNGTDWLCISDTLNRRGLILDKNLKIISQIKLDIYSKIPRFLCRVPSLLNEEICFIDYESGITVFTDLKLNFLRLETINIDLYNLSNVRRIFPIMGGFLLLGRTKEKIHSPIVFVKESLNSKLFIGCPKDYFFTPVDLIKDKNNYFLLDKEESKLHIFDIQWIIDFNESK